MLSAEHIAEIDGMTDRQAVAVWNILQWNGMSVSDAQSRAHDEAVRQHLSLVLTQRGIAHERGKRTVVA